MMWPRFPAVCLITVGLCGTALAEESPAATTDPSDPQVAANPPEKQIEYGVGFRLRNVVIPTAELELFLERSSGGSNNVGFGFDLTRRRGNVELQLGFEYEKLTVGEGVWIATGDTVPADEADWVLSPEDSGKSLGWVTFEFTFLNHAPITKNISIRYGGGAGLGIVLGELRHYDIQCAAGSTNENVDPGCKPPRFQGTGQYGGDTPGQEVARAYDLPPVFPVVNAIIGVQFKPTEKITLNLEGGLRTLLFWGISGSYFF